MTPPKLRRYDVPVMLAVSAALVAATAFGWWSIGWTEVIGFVTGGICVWLVVREHIANWPIGLANNVTFFVLFWNSRLFADAGLQIVYFALGVYGWWNWHRADTQTELPVTHTTRREWLFVALFVPLATLAMIEILTAVNGAAPFGDAVTTALSLAAQFLMTRKRLEHWLIWITADAIYVPLYVNRDLPLTAALYGVFLIMCVVGYVEWRRKGASP